MRRLEIRGRCYGDSPTSVSVWPARLAFVKHPPSVSSADNQSQRERGRERKREREKEIERETEAQDTLTHCYSIGEALGEEHWR